VAMYDHDTFLPLCFCSYGITPRRQASAARGRR
jgi:hypothetical protein